MKKTPATMTMAPICRFRIRLIWPRPLRNLMPGVIRSGRCCGTAFRLANRPVHGIRDWYPRKKNSGPVSRMATFPMVRTRELYRTANRPMRRQENGAADAGAAGPEGVRKPLRIQWNRRPISLPIPHPAARLRRRIRKRRLTGNENGGGEDGVLSRPAKRLPRGTARPGRPETDGGGVQNSIHTENPCGGSQVTVMGVRRVGWVKVSDSACSRMRCCSRSEAP